jgi:deoxyribodipyrimidine photo-lyase
METAISDERISVLNDKEIIDGSYVLYWMQQSQRAEWNQALEYAIEQAQQLGQGVIVGFGLMEDYPDANLRHYTFMLQGLKEVKESLSKRKIKFVLQKGHPAQVALDIGKQASIIICDRGYLKHQRKWRKEVAEKSNCKVIQVECDAVVPVESASGKEEYAARTIRSTIKEQLQQFKVEVHHGTPPKSSLPLAVKGLELDNIEALLDELKVDNEPGPVTGFFKGGTSEAKKRFKKFLEQSYLNYNAHRSEPHKEDVSFMSPFLHFGQISPLWILNELKGKRGENRESYEEELVVRRELAINFCYYNKQYDSLNSLPEWADSTLKEHKDDEREKVYTMEQLEQAETNDPYWNACMKLMKKTGYLHNHMRMYWGKQILTYTNTPQYAHKVALHLNNKYFLDGRDCNSYANIAWLFGKHDRAWAEREVFGKVRTMTQSGLERKINEEKFLDFTKQKLNDNN